MLCTSGLSGQDEGVRAYKVQMRRLCRKYPQFIVMNVITVSPAKRLPARALPSVAMRVKTTVAVG